MKRISVETRVGAFALGIVALLIWATLRVSDQSSVSGGGYEIAFRVDSATGLKPKAPVELAGVQVGIVRSITLDDSRQAMVWVKLNQRVRLPEDSRVVLRTRGFLGEAYVELIPGTPGAPLLPDDGVIADAQSGGDINSLVQRFNLIADDLQAITKNVRHQAGGEDAPVNRVIANLEQFTQAIRDVTIRNTENIDRIAANMAQLSERLNNASPDVQQAMQNLNQITGKINRGEGTIGKLVNNDETADKLHQSLDSFNETLGGFRQLETQVGFHTEYFVQSKDFKNYVHLNLMPSPDKALLLALVSDPDPRPTYTQNTTTITAGGNTSTVQTLNASTDSSKLLFTAQLAKKYYDFTLRGGIIESTGGFGADYDYGPMGLEFSAFDWSTRFGQKPHLKAMATVNLTRNFVLLGGADDFINQPQRNYFMGAGFRFVDDDIKNFARFGGSAGSLTGK